MKFAIFFSLQPQAIDAAMRNPSDRAAAVSGLVEALDGRLEAYYWMLGPHDGMVIVDVPDPAAAAAASLAVGSSGAFSHLETHQLFEAAEVQPLLDRAAQARGGYRPIGG